MDDLENKIITKLYVKNYEMPYVRDQQTFPVKEVHILDFVDHKNCRTTQFILWLCRSTHTQYTTHKGMGVDVFQ